MTKPMGALKSGHFFNSSINRIADRCERAKIRGTWGLQCVDSQGNLKWEDKIDPNLVVNVGLDYLLDVGLASGTQLPVWYVGLVDAFTYPSGAAGDTMASHAGWTEYVNYSEAERVRWVNAAVSSQSITNSASKASFAINQDTQTVEGAFLVGGANSHAKNIGSGSLYAVGAFTGGTKSVDNGDTLQVTATFTSADDGV